MPDPSTFVDAFRGMLADLPDPVPAADRPALAEAWRAECGSPLNEMDLAILAGQGTTPEEVARIAGIARRALAAGVPSSLTGTATAMHTLARALWLVKASLRPVREFTGEEVFSWLTAGAGSPDCRVESPLTVLPLDAPVIAGWWKRLSDGWAPLCWAAGLSITEAVERHEAGTLHRDELAALAALRGWRLLPLPENRA